jgi:hypothetical protein
MEPTSQTDSDIYFEKAKAIYASLPGTMTEDEKQEEVERRILAQVEEDVAAVDERVATEINQLLEETKVEAEGL